MPKRYITVLTESSALKNWPLHRNGGNIKEMGRLREKFFKGDSDRLITLEELDILIETLSRMGVEESI